MDFRRKTKVYCVAWAMVALIGALAVAGPASAQTPTASIVGTVLDPQGLPVEGANVTLTNQGTNYTYNTTTSSTGAFQFSSIDSGLYRVTVTSSSFRAAVVENIKVDTSTNYSVPPIKLEVGSAKETITVEAGAEVVNTTDTEVASTVDKKQIEDLQTEQVRLGKRLTVLAPSVTKDYFRNAPLLDFMAPTIKVQQIILPNVVDDVNFIRVPKMDRCQTCHLAIDKKGYIEDRRPNANCDPYVVTRLIIETVCGAVEKRRPTLLKSAKAPARSKAKAKKTAA